jgi:hypothetical protein
MPEIEKKFRVLCRSELRLPDQNALGVIDQSPTLTVFELPTMITVRLP